MSKQVEIERKYVIKMPDLSLLKEKDGYSESKILQIYLTADAGVTHRIRKRSFAGFDSYTENKKTRIDAMSSYEEENEISEAEFAALSEKIKDGTNPILKTRYTFLFCGITFEIDVYPNWKRSAIMETELESREVSAQMPDFIEIISEVTGERKYSNASMAHAFPEELI